MQPNRQRPKFGATKVLLMGCAILMLWQGIPVWAAEPTTQDAPSQSLISASPIKSPVHLYFADRNNHFLTAEQRVISHLETAVSLAEAIIEELIKGPQAGHIKTIPPGTQLRAIYITPDGSCYVDLSEEVKKHHPGGSKSELFTLYSMVNSLVLNVPEIERVKILIDGKEALTLAGHIDLQPPVKANMLLIR